MPISKAVVPVAGLGTRLLPTTKAIPKEMLPVGRYPVIQHVVDELIQAGLDYTLFVTSRSKGAIDNYFDDYSELMLHLELDGSEMREVSRFDYRQRGIEFFSTRQQVPLGQTKPLGTGDAVAAAETFTDGAPFVVAFGDSIIHSRESTPLLSRMIASHQQHRSACTIAVCEVAASMVGQYGIVVPEATATTAADCRLTDIVEKPDPCQIDSRLAVSARYIFGPEIFAAIAAVPPAPQRRNLPHRRHFAPHSDRLYGPRRQVDFPGKALRHRQPRGLLQDLYRLRPGRSPLRPSDPRPI